ncbi:MAG TPA: DUF1289 domain-containing protein [Alphaproteobacteria bacterium]|nr:DUF1289 domain-containing protein [Alphaproteobacteria bacterium]
MISPCIKVCKLDDSREYCVGCGRTLQEIRAWPTMTDPQRLAIIQRLALAKFGV